MLQTLVFLSPSLSADIDAYVLPFRSFTVFGDVMLIIFCFSFRKSPRLGFNYAWVPPSLTDTQLQPSLWSPSVAGVLSGLLPAQKAEPGARRKKGC